MRIGSLCSGYGGLELGVSSVIGGDVAWHSEIDPAASAVLERRFTGVPNIGVNGGVAVTIRSLYRPDLGDAIRYVNGDAETTITIR